MIQQNISLEQLKYYAIIYTAPRIDLQMCGIAEESPPYLCGFGYNNSKI